MAKINNLAIPGWGGGGEPSFEKTYGMTDGLIQLTLSLLNFST